MSGTRAVAGGGGGGGGSRRRDGDLIRGASTRDVAGPRGGFARYEEYRSRRSVGGDHTMGLPEYRELLSSGRSGEEKVSDAKPPSGKYDLTGLTSKPETAVPVPTMTIPNMDDMPRIEAVFQYFSPDDHRRGFIPIHHLGDAMRTCGAVISQEELAKLIREVDADGAGLVPFAMFCVVTKRYQKRDFDLVAIQDAFTVLNGAMKRYHPKAAKRVDRDSVVSAAFLREMLTTVGETLTVQEGQEILNALGISTPEKPVSMEMFVKRIVMG